MAELKIVNNSKCRREFVLDTQEYYEENGKLRLDVNGRPVEPKLTTLNLQQGANAVDAKLWDALKAADKKRDKPYLSVLIEQRILREEQIKPGNMDGKNVKPVQVDDLSEYTVASAKKIIEACSDPQQLRKFVDQDPREVVRTALRERWMKIVEPTDALPKEFELQELG